MGAPQPAHLGAAHLGLAHCAVGWLSPACPPGLQEASFLGAEPPNPSLSHRLGFSWEGLAQFPEPPKDGQHPDMDDPVTVRTVQRYTKALVEEAKLRAAWFQTPHVLWPWVSSVPGPLAASQTRRDPSGLGSRSDWACLCSPAGAGWTAALSCDRPSFPAPASGLPLDSPPTSP